MKKLKYLLIAVSVSGISASAFADAPDGHANHDNVPFSDHDRDDLCRRMHDHMENADRKIAEAIKKDAHQDAEGQKRLDQEWNELLRELGYDPKDPNAPKDPFTYEGSPADMKQDAKILANLNAYLIKHGRPPVSSIE